MDAMEKNGAPGARPEQTQKLWVRFKTLLTRMIDEHFCTILSGGGVAPPKERKNEPKNSPRS